MQAVIQGPASALRLTHLQSPHRVLWPAQQRPEQTGRSSCTVQRCRRFSSTCQAWQQQQQQPDDPRIRGQRQQQRQTQNPQGRTVVEPEVLPRNERPDWAWPPPPPPGPPPPPPPPPPPGQGVGQMTGSRRMIFGSLLVVGAAVGLYQAIRPKPLSEQRPDQWGDTYGRRGMPQVVYAQGAVLVKRITNGDIMEVVSGDQPGQLLLRDQRTRMVYEMRLGINDKIDVNKRDLMNSIFMMPGWELGLRPYRQD